MRATASIRRDLVRVQAEGGWVDDGYGNSVPSGWETKLECWARIQPLKGTEAVIAARMTGVQPVIITIPITPETEDITTAWRVLHADNGETYDINSVANMDERGEYWEILAVAQT